MPSYLVAGAGPTGSRTAERLAAEGAHVRLVSRRGTGPEHPGIHRIAADASDPARMTELAAGTRTVFNCVMPAYDEWPKRFPPITRSLLDAAAHAGADFAMVGNLYAYVPPDGPVAEDRPLGPISVKGGVRAAMWAEALAAQVAGRVRVTEVRGSDYIGAGAVSLLSLMIAPQLLRGEPAAVPADLDAPHSWTLTDDVAATLVAVSRGDAAWGRAWHVPSNPPVSVRDLTSRFAAIAGVDEYVLEEMSYEAVAEAAARDSIWAELQEVQYLDRRPIVLDSSLTQRTFGLEPGSLDDALAATAAEHAVPV